MHDMKFLQRFLLYMFVKTEFDYPLWQEKKPRLMRRIKVAEKAYVDSMRLLKDGKEVTLKSWASDIINEMFGMCEVLGH